uniref:Uncharacterized protein n=1 Tax=Glossina palpalis gambiensis TaxID=67801 RepID=A0A1B0BJM4_9MUSC
KECNTKDCKRSGKQSYTNKDYCETPVKNWKTLVANITGYTQQQICINSQGKFGLFHKYLKLILQKLLTNSKLKILINKVSSFVVANGSISRSRQLSYANCAAIQHCMLQFILVATNVGGRSCLVLNSS